MKLAHSLFGLGAGAEFNEGEAAQLPRLPIRWKR
jgi:hypothetical protein